LRLGVGFGTQASW